MYNDFFTKPLSKKPIQNNLYKLTTKMNKYENTVRQMGKRIEF